jgi:hypothetical protein
MFATVSVAIASPDAKAHPEPEPEAEPHFNIRDDVFCRHEYLTTYTQHCETVYTDHCETVYTTQYTTQYDQVCNPGETQNVGKITNRRHFKLKIMYI